MIKSVILKGIIFLAMGSIPYYAMDDTELKTSDSNSEEVKYTLIDWMHPICKSIFNRKDFIEQHHIRAQIIEHSFEIAGLIGQAKEDKQKISLYLCQIANDQNPIGENPLLAMYNKNNPNYEIASKISNVLYKILTNQIVIVDRKAVNSKFFLMSKK